MVVVVVVVLTWRAMISTFWQELQRRLKAIAGDFTYKQ